MRLHLLLLTNLLLLAGARDRRAGASPQGSDRFIDFIESYGLDLTEEEKGSINEAKADREAGRSENFVALDDLEKELGL